MRFEARSPFGKRPPSVEEKAGPMRAADLRREGTVRRPADVRAASDLLSGPALLPGHALHAVTAGRIDMTAVMRALAQRYGRIAAARIATLSLGRANVDELLALHADGLLGTASLLASAYFRDMEPELWADARDRLRAAGHRVAACRTHRKVIALEFEGGMRLAIEGSANLRSNGSAREQFMVAHDAGLHDFHAAWIDALVDQHGGEGEGAADG
jgi:hypothetical protein